MVVVRMRAVIDAEPTCGPLERNEREVCCVGRDCKVPLWNEPLRPSLRWPLPKVGMMGCWVVGGW